VNYIAGNYQSAVEIGIGSYPDLAFALMGRGTRVFATDIRAFQYDGLKVLVDDVTEPDIAAYGGADLIYSLRPPPELIPHMVRLAAKAGCDLIIKPLSSEHPGGQLARDGNTTFFIWGTP
jgi:uncharacterized UPF0146 family protein